MKVSFVYPDFSLGAGGKFYHGLAFISAVLKKNGHKVSLVHLTQAQDSAALLNSLEQQAPDLVGFSITTNTFAYAREAAGWIRSRFNIPVGFGGVHPSLDPEGTIAVPGVDFAVIGEGEDALVEICDILEKGRDPSGIKNVWWKANGKIIRNPVRPLIADLDTLPFPDRALFDMPALEDSRLRRASFMASRGCPFQCAFCCNHKLQKLSPTPEKYVRFRSVEDLITEMETVLREYPFIETISLHDDILNLHKKWFDEFTEKYRQRIGLPFSCNTHPSLINGESAAKLKEAGCTNLAIGLESGNETIRKSVLNRKILNSAMETAFGAAKSAGLRIASFNMTGIPGEDISQALDTVKMNARIKPQWMQISILYPYIGTTLYDLCREKNYLTSQELTSYFEDTVLSLPSMKRSQIIFIARYFTLLVGMYRMAYSFPKKIAAVLESTIDRLFCSRLFPFQFFVRIHPVFGLLSRVLESGRKTARICLPKTLTKFFRRSFSNA